MIKLTENQLRALIRQVLSEAIDPDKIDKQGGGMSNHPGQTLGPGETVGENPAGDWTHYDLGKDDFGDHDALDEMDEEEEE
tara:strand:- start:482 stop:724 length:243 start_codon:yes stop_codon:yes gene_type:complete